MPEDTIQIIIPRDFADRAHVIWKKHHSLIHIPKSMFLFYLESLSFLKIYQFKPVLLYKRYSQNKRSLPFSPPPPVKTDKTDNITLPKLCQWMIIRRIHEQLRAFK